MTIFSKLTTYETGEKNFKDFQRENAPKSHSCTQAMGSEHSYLREITLPYPRERKELLLGRENLELE